jgi:hypothetical protein
MTTGAEENRSTRRNMCPSTNLSTANSTYSHSSPYEDSHYEISLIRNFTMKRIPSAWWSACASLAADRERFQLLKREVMGLSVTASGCDNRPDDGGSRHLKRRYTSTRLHGAASRKTVIFGLFYFHPIRFSAFKLAVPFGITDNQQPSNYDNGNNSWENSGVCRDMGQRSWMV